ncbi:hypothetical protein B0T24DRAFT_593882 [Lasiosphaeria ovina]|uniref:Uncharacterized protein n=1 Tax=Lasiosphaeria ovina TaxID=92902 RepID=A0AAE0N7M1_9PEZI|nr:hypothetical protein B0T24DRAFT_593882 [Lasiosphaeria ovina]
MSEEAIFTLVALNPEAQFICKCRGKYENDNGSSTMRLFVETKSETYRDTISLPKGYKSNKKGGRLLSFGIAVGHDVCLDPQKAYRDISSRRMFSDDECYFSFNESKELCLHDTSDGGTTKIDDGHGVILADARTNTVIIPKTTKHVAIKIGRGEGAVFLFKWGGPDNDIEGAINNMRSTFNAGNKVSGIVENRINPNKATPPGQGGDPKKPQVHSSQLVFDVARGDAAPKPSPELHRSQDVTQATTASPAAVKRVREFDATRQDAAATLPSELPRPIVRARDDAASKPPPELHRSHDVTQATTASPAAVERVREFDATRQDAAPNPPSELPRLIVRARDDAASAATSGVNVQRVKRQLTINSKEEHLPDARRRQEIDVRQPLGGASVNSYEDNMNMNAEELRIMAMRSRA